VSKSVFKISDGQKQMLSGSEKDIIEGKLISNEDLNEEIDGQTSSLDPYRYFKKLQNKKSLPFARKGFLFEVNQQTTSPFSLGL
jgi:hypothetical protein